MSQPNPNFPGIRSLHDTMQRSRYEALGEEMKVVSVRIPENTLDLAKIILHNHGINYSEWVRECTECLVRDYQIKP